MALEVVDRKVIWNASGLDIGATTTLANNGSYWMLPNNTLSTSTSTIATTYWHKINTKDADRLIFHFKGTVNSLAAGDDTVTTSRIYPVVLGIPDGLQGTDAGEFGTGFPYWLSNSTTYNTATQWKPYFLWFQPADGYTYESTNVDDWPASKATAGAYITESGLVPGDASIPAAADTVSWSLEVGELPSTKITTGASVREAGILNVSRFSEVNVIFRVFQEQVAVTARLDIDDYDGQLVAITYREVQKVDKIDRRNVQRKDRFQSISAY